MRTTRTLLLAAAVIAAASCTVKEEFERLDLVADGPVFEAVIEDADEADTKVYADENLMVLWHQDDRVSIFNHLTYNAQYKFDGKTGDNSGSFSKIPDDSFVTGNELSYAYAVYPYRAANSISNSGLLTLTLPEEQEFATGSFGRGANTMVAVADNNVLVFKNLCGYLMFKLYGPGLTVERLTLTANGGESLAGKATVSMAPGGVPSAVLASEGASSTITVNCPTPVALGDSAENYTEFWFALPPVTFSQGFTLVVTMSDASTFEKSVSSSVTINRNRRSRMSPLLVEPTGIPVPPDDEIWYTTTDGSVIEPKQPDSINASIVSNTYENGKGIIKFSAPVTSLGTDAFYYVQKLKTINLPNSVTELGNYAFQSDYDLESIRLPDNLQTIKAYAFNGCTKLSTIAIPSSVTSLGDGAFSYCTSLSAFYGKFASSDHRMLVNNNEVLAFAQEGLTSYTIPEGITRLGNYSLYESNSLQELALPNSLKEIGNNALAYCYNLSSLNLPGALTTIGTRAFFRCSFSSITIPDSVTQINESAFAYCINLESFSGKFATSDGRALISNKNVLLAFAPKDLTSYTVPEGVTRIGNYAFAYANALNEVILPQSLTDIGSYAFYSCQSLNGLTLPEGLTTIGGDAFANCSFSEITIPSTVTIVNGYAFYNNSSLKTATFKPKSPPKAGNNMFQNCDNVTIYVPVSALNAYKTAQYWSNYADRILSIPGDVFFEVSPESVMLSSSAQSFTITVETNKSYHADIPANVSWITAGDVSGSQADGFKHVFNVSKNDGDERKAVISVCTDDGTCHPVTVTQKASDPLVDGFDWSQTFYHRSLFMRFTATWCGYCPNMATSVKMAQERNPGKIEAVNIHGGGSYLEFSNYSTFVNQFAITAYPSGIVNGRRLIQNWNNDYTVSKIEDAIKESENNYPLSSTIGFDSYFSGRNLSIDLNLFIRYAADYKVTVLILEDGIIEYQADNYEGSHTDYVHNEVARIPVTDVSGDAFTVDSDLTVKQLCYSVSIPSQYNIDNLRVLVYVQRAYGSQSVLSDGSYGDYYIDNCASGKAGEKLPPAVMSGGSGNNEDFGHGDNVNW